MIEICKFWREWDDQEICVKCGSEVVCCGEKKLCELGRKHYEPAEII